MDSETLSSSPDVDGCRYWASFSPTSFSKGSKKNSHAGVLNGNGPRAGQKAVVKAFKHEFGTEELCDMEILKYTTAEKLACVFNSQYGYKEKISFCKPLKAVVDRVAVLSWFSLDKKKLSDNEWVLITKNMKKHFHRWVSKSGSPCRHAPDIMQAFVHFSYDYTAGDLVICDLKGMATESGFELNTPVIHSHHKRFGKCDNGDVGVVVAFDLHTCNDLCKNMIVPNLIPHVRKQSLPIDIPLQASAPFDPCLENEPSSPLVSCPLPPAPPPYELYPAFTFPDPGESYQDGSGNLKYGFFSS